MPPLFLVVLLAAAAAGCGAAAGRPAPGAAAQPVPIVWNDGAAASAGACPAFDAVAPGADGWWLSGPDCLLHAPADETRASLLALRRDPWAFDRVDSVAADAAGGVWAAGRQRTESAARPLLAEVRDGDVAIGPPGQWGFAGAVIHALRTSPAGVVWAVGRRDGAAPAPFLARRRGLQWSVLDTTAFGAGELHDADFSADGCGWIVGRNGDGSGLLIRYDGRTLHKEVLDRADGVPRRVAALSCGDVWLGGASLIRYAEGHREEIAFGREAAVNGLAACPNGDVLLVGERVAAEPGMDGRRVGFAFRVRGGAATALPVALPFVVDDWRLADVGCDARGAWAVGGAAARFTVDGPAQPRPLVLRLAGSGWQYRGWNLR